MSNCICATTRPKSGMKRPKIVASFIQRSTVSGFLCDGQNIHKQRIGARIIADLDLDQLGVAIGRRIVPDGFPARCSASAKISISRTGSCWNQLSCRRGHPPAVRRKPRQIRAARAQIGEATTRLFQRSASSMMGEEHAGQIADLLREQEIMLHERSTALCRAGRHSASARQFRAGHRRSGALRRVGDRVEMARTARRNPSAFGTAEFARGQQAVVHQFGGDFRTRWTYLPIQNSV